MVIFDGLGRALRFLREQRGKSQKDVAVASGVTAPMLSAYETGRTRPEIDTLDRILDNGLGSSLRELSWALDVVNHRLPPAHRDSVAPSLEPSMPKNKALPSELEDGYQQVLQGLLGISQFFYKTLQAVGLSNLDDKPSDEE